LNWPDIKQNIQSTAYLPQASSTFSNVSRPALKTRRLECYKYPNTNITSWCPLQPFSPIFASPSTYPPTADRLVHLQKDIMLPSLPFCAQALSLVAILLAQFSQPANALPAPQTDKMLAGSLRCHNPVSDDTILFPGRVVLHRRGLYYGAHGKLRSVV